MMLGGKSVFLFVGLITLLLETTLSQNDGSGDQLTDSLFTTEDLPPVSKSILLSQSILASQSMFILSSQSIAGSQFVSPSQSVLTASFSQDDSLSQLVSSSQSISPLLSSSQILSIPPTSSPFVQMQTTNSVVQSSSSNFVPSPSTATSSTTAMITSTLTTSTTTVTTSSMMLTTSTIMMPTSIAMTTSSVMTTSSTMSTTSTIMMLTSTAVTTFSTIVTTSTYVTTSSSMVTTSQTGSANTGILDQIQDVFSNSTVTLVVAIGGSCIILLLIAIVIFCCCLCCRRRKGRYTVENSSGNAEVTENHYRRKPSISNPIPSYKMALKNVQEQRQRIDDFVETELGPDVDDALHYQGHSQVQHSQPYSPLSDVGNCQSSLSKLTPFNPSQMMSQARGGISVDDIDEEIPEKDAQIQHVENTRADGGGDSPFMHLSDNLTGSRGRISQRSTSDPHTDLIGTVTQPSQASQYSHLGLGVLHGGDVVFTNTASLAEELQGSLGMVGIDQSLLLSKESDLHSHRTASPLLVETSADLDETPVREKPVATAVAKPKDKSKNVASLTSLTSLTPTKLPRSSTPTDESNQAAGKKLNLSLITSLPSSADTTDDKNFTASDTGYSNLQETPERHRRHTVDSSSAFKRNPGKSQSRLGKLTSLEYIRASLRMKLNRIKRNESVENDVKKKPLKSAMRKTSVNSQGSSPDSANSSKNNSFVYSNRHAFPYNDMSPQHPQLPSPHFYSQDPYMRSPNLDDFPVMGPEAYGPVSGMYPHGPGYPHMMALSPPGYAPEPLSPILSVSQYDHPGMYPAHEIGILPQYGEMHGNMHPAAMMGGYHDQVFPSKPPHYDDDDDDDDDNDDDMPALHSPYRGPGDNGGGASQRNVTWNLEPVEIPELTPSDIEDDLR